MGDHEGVVQLFSLKRGEMQVGFKTLPGDQITRVQLGGALGKFVVCQIINVNLDFSYTVNHALDIFDFV